jgi:hypothetical protein
MSTTQAAPPDRFRIDIGPSEHVTAIAYRAAAPERAGITLILAHGAGANPTFPTGTLILRFWRKNASRINGR